MINNNKKLEFYDILNSIKMEYLKTKEPFDIIQQNIKLTHKTISLKYINDKNYFIKIKKQKDNRGSDSYNKSYKPTDHNKSYKPTDHNKSYKPTDHNKSYKPTDHNRDWSHSPNKSQSENSRGHKPTDHNKSYKPTDHNKSYKPTDHNKSYKPTDHNRDRSQSPTGRVFTQEETDAYLERKKHRENNLKSVNPNIINHTSYNRDRSQSPNKSHIHNKSQTENNRDRGRNENNRDRSQSPTGRVFTQEETDAYLERKKRRENNLDSISPVINHKNIGGSAMPSKIKIYY
jgi:hypothetical protein